MTQTTAAREYRPPSPDDVRAALSFVPAYDRDLWLKMGMAVKDELGEEGFSIWDEWSQTAEDSYREKDARQVWKSFHKNGVSIGSLFFEAKQRGYQFAAKKPEPATAEQTAAREQKRQEDERKAKEKTERAKQTANALWSKATPAISHPYLTKKGVKPYGVRVGTYAYYVLNNASEWEQRQNENCLLVPLRDSDGAVWNLQAIFPEVDRELERDKHFLSGGRVSGLYYSIGKAADVICICEGFATGGSIHEATGYAVAVAFNASNLPHVAKILREKYPEAKIIVCADNDQWKKPGENPGLKKATEAAQAVAGLLAVPHFKNTEGQPTDFNDLHQREGFEAVRAAINSAINDVLSVHGWPEPKDLHPELLPVAPLPKEIIPEPFQNWITDVSERMQCPPDFVAATAMVMVGSIIGAGCGIRPKRLDNWLVVPNLWGGIVAGPSMMKSPTIAEGMTPLMALEAEAAREYENAEKEHEADKEAFKAHKEALRDSMTKVAKGKETAGSMDDAKKRFRELKEPDAPVCKRYKSNDATVEKMGELLSNNSRGLLILRDELIGLLASWDKEEHQTDRAFYLEAWNGTNSTTTDRIGRGTIRIENACVSIFGGIQPIKLMSYLYPAIRGTENDGLLQRLQLLVYPDEPQRWELIDRQPNRVAKERATAIVKKLAGMDFESYGAQKDEWDRFPFFRFDDAAQEIFNEWYTELHQTKLKNSGDHRIMVEHLAKYSKLMPSLALIIHLIEVADGKAKGPVSAKAAAQAVEWCYYLESHARRIYGLVGNIEIQAATKLGTKIKQGSLTDGFNARHVRQKGWELLTDQTVVQQACDELVEAGWLRVIPQEKASTGGRPALATYAINPKAIA